MRNKFAEVVHQQAKINRKIAVLVADISPAGAIVDFRKEFPERFINTGVSEQSMIGIAAGMALRGFKPFCYTIATFSLYRPFEMVRDDLGYQNLPVTVIGMGAGVIYSTLGATHHTMEDISIASAIPNMTVLAPCDPEEMKLATQWCANESTGPVYMRLGKAGEPDLTKNSVDPFKIGKIRYLRRGHNIAILAYGNILDMAVKLADSIENQNRTISVLSCHTLKPFDIAGVQQVLNDHDEVIVIEEHVPAGGLSSRVKEIAWNSQAKVRLSCFSLKDEFIHFYGDHSQLLSMHGLSVNQIKTALGY